MDGETTFFWHRLRDDVEYVLNGAPIRRELKMYLREAIESVESELRMPAPVPAPMVVYNHNIRDSIISRSRFVPEKGAD